MCAVHWRSARSSVSRETIETTTGTLPATLAVSVSAAGLTPGVYTGSIRVTSAGTTREMPVELEVATQAPLSIQPGRLSLSSQFGTLLGVCAPVRIGSFGNTPVNWAASASEPWLAVLPASGQSPGTASVCATAEKLAPGQYTGSVSITAQNQAGAQSVAVSFSVTPAPELRGGGVVNAATFLPNQPIAPGEMVTLFGANLASGAARASGFPLPMELADSRVVLGGVPAPLLYVSPGQINFVTPFSLAESAGSATNLNVYTGRLATAPIRLEVARRAPGIFTVLGNGVGAGAITHADGSLVTRTAPVAAGEIVSVYLTGIGPLDREVADGAPASADPLARAIGPLRLRFDGQEAEVLFAGAAPGFAGLQVVVASVPQSLRRRFPEVVVEAQGAPSNRTTAGGPSLLDAAPASVRAGSDAVVTLRGVNLAPTSAVRVAGETLPAVVTEGDLETLRVLVPARLLRAPGAVTLEVFDADAGTELASNPVVITVE